MKVGVLTLSLAVLLVGGLSFNAVAGPATDSDGDGTFDVLDGCSDEVQAPAPLGCDTDNDGYLNACDGDLNNDGGVNGADFSSPALPDFLECFLSGVDAAGIGCDFNCDGAVNGADFSSPGTPDFLEFFAAGTPGPSGLPCAGTVPCP